MDSSNITIFDYAADEVSKLVRLATSVYSCVSIQALQYCFIETVRHRCLEDTRSNRDNTDAKAPEISCHWQGKTINCSLCC